jgi:hypothetical protein
MKLTTARLKKLIREELDRMQESEHSAAMHPAKLKKRGSGTTKDGQAFSTQNYSAGGEIKGVLTIGDKNWAIHPDKHQDVIKAMSNNTKEEGLAELGLKDKAGRPASDFGL